MNFNEIREIVFQILQEAGPKFMLPYQIFERIEERDSELARQLVQEYHGTEGNPPMGHGAGIYYSPASFISHALEYFSRDEPNPLRQEWIEPRGLFVSQIEAGNSQALSIWTLRQQTDPTR